MSLPTYFDADASLAPLEGRLVGVLGYGSQGAAHALNLRDSGVAVRIGLYAGSPSAARARAAGFQVDTVEAVARAAAVLSCQVPDEVLGPLYAEAVQPHLAPDATLVFSHGYNLQYGGVQPAPGLDAILVAPLGPGPLVREAYTRGDGVPCLIAVARNASGHAKATALAYARAIGGTRRGAMETSVREETETDLFGEQAVLCGGVAELVRASFEVLVEAGYAPELAYTASLHELKQTVDLMQARGIAGMNRQISNTAEFGEYRIGPRIITPATKAAMREVLDEIRSGRFARAWAAETRAGLPTMNRQRAALAAHPIERVGAAMRRQLGLESP